MANTPWGRSDNKEILAPGIVFYTTPGHGGYKIYKFKLKQMPERFQNADGWYEEDCEANKVIVCFPGLFPQAKVDHAKQMVEKYFDSQGNYKTEA
jgi:hypothetical protein